MSSQSTFSLNMKHFVCVINKSDSWLIMFCIFRISINSAMKWHWSTWIQVKFSRCGGPPSRPSMFPRPLLSSDRDYTTHECWSAGLEMWGGVLLRPLWPCCWLNVARKRFSGSNQRTARLHCPAELSTVELWTLTLFPRLSLLLSVCTFQRELDRSHTPALTWRIFYSTSTLMYFIPSCPRVTAALHVSDFFLIIILFFFFLYFLWSLLLPVTPLSCLFILGGW